MDEIEEPGPGATREELEEDLVFTRILIESLDPEAFEYEELLNKHSRRIAIVERRLGLEPGEGSQMASQESWNSALAPQDNAYEIFEDLLSPIANYNTTQAQQPITPPQLRRASMADFTVDTGSRKRPANLLSLSPPRGSPAKRATPSPADSAPHTPGSDALPESAFVDLTQPSSSRFPATQASRVASDSVLRRHREAARAHEERQKRLQADIQLANSFSLGLPSQRPPPSQSSTQAVFNNDGTIRRISSLNNSKNIKAEANAQNKSLFANINKIKAEPRGYADYSASSASGSRLEAEPNGYPYNASPFTGSSRFKAETNGYAGSTTSSHIKNETLGSSHDSQTPFRPQNSQPRATIQIDSDSELEEIDAEVFKTAERRKDPARRLNRPQAASPAVQPLPRSQVQHNSSAMHIPGAMNGYSPYAAYQQPAIAHSNGFQHYNSAYSALPQASMGFMPGDPRATGVRQAMNSYSMPGAFPDAPTLLGQDAYARLSSTRPGGSQYNSHTSRSAIPMLLRTLIDLDDDGDILPGEYAHLASDPTRTRAEINELIAEVAQGGEFPPELRHGTPDAFKLPLMEHQKNGFTWMKKKEAGSTRGGILADDMGLGKTLQALAVIVENQAEDRSRKTTLVVAPVALLFQWKEEIADKIKRDKALKVYVHHGQKKRPFRMLRDFDVVLTTYGSLASELKRYDHWCAVVKNDANAMPSKNEQMSLLGPECKWYRVILDEAQCIKNKDTAAAKAAYKLDAIYRWCMTGTPMMNNVFELFSLIHFCRIRPFNDIQKFRNDIKNPLERQDEGGRAEAMKTLQALIRGIMLRRTKQSKLDGKPIITLPARTNAIVSRAFEKDQEDFYRAVELQSAAIFSKYLKAGTVVRNYGHVLTLLLRLRQITDHPILATQVVDDSGVETSEKDMLTMVNKLSPDVIRRLKDHNGDFMCPICIDAIPAPGPIIFFPCGHYLDNDCLSSLVMNATANADTEVKCPECRDKFDPKKVIDYPTFVKVHMPEQASQEAGEEQGAAIEEDSDSDLESDSDSDDEGSLKDFIVDDDVTEDEAAEADGESVNEDANAVGGEPVPQPASNFMRNGADGRRKKGKGKGKQNKDKKKKKSLAELRKEGRKNKKAWQKYLRRLEKTWETSAKIEQTLELLQKIDAEKPKEKVLIFSQFTSFLDFLEVPLRRAEYVYERYDGSMNAKEREAAVNSFKSNPRMKLMLISLKAGNSGLNLNCASQVIILDPFWNPFIEEQAIDRAHRIGQQHEVNVHRIVIPNTVEDRILQLQEKKRDLINTALDEKAGKSLSRLGVRELGYLFGVNAAPT